MIDNRLYELIKNKDTILNDVDFIIIANTTNKNYNKSNIKPALDDELFSRQEFAEIASAIYDSFGFVQVFYNEIDFIEFIINKQKIRKNLFVFNYARNGTKSGKKSLIPAFCDLFNIRYSGSDAFTISLIRNKYIVAQYLKYHNLPVPNTWQCQYNNFFSDFNEKNLHKKYILKTIDESASIGMNDQNIFLPKTMYELMQNVHKIEQSMQNSNLLIQEFIDGQEIEILVLQYKNEYIACEPIELHINGNNILTSEISLSYDYSFSKFQSLNYDDITNKIKSICVEMAKLLNIKDYARFDFRVKDNNDIFLIDIAGTPYCIKHSSIAYLFKEIYKLEYKDIFKLIASLSWTNYQFNEVNCRADRGNPL